MPPPHARFSRLGTSPTCGSGRSPSLLRPSLGFLVHTGVGGARSVVLRQHSGGERSRRRNRSPRSELPSCGRPIPLLPQRPVHLAPLPRGFSLCPNIGNHLPRSRICFGAEERNSPRVIIGKASSPALRPGGRGFLDANRGGTTSKGEPSLRPGLGRCGRLSRLRRPQLRGFRF